MLAPTVGTEVTLLLPGGERATAVVVRLNDRRESRASVRVVIASSGDWFRVDSRESSLSDFPMLRRLLRALIVKHLEAPNTLTPVSELIPLLWPDSETPIALSRQRVHSLVHRLRRRGLGSALVARRDGYMLMPNVSIEDPTGLRATGDASGPRLEFELRSDWAQRMGRGDVKSG